MKRLMILWTAAALALQASACGDGGEVVTGPDQAGLGFEEISAGEIAAAAHLEDLSDEDRAAVREALQAARADIRAILQRLRSGELTPEEARAEVRAVHDALIESLSAYLTEEQIERLLRHRPGHPRPDLDLTDDQRAAIQELRQEFQAFLRELRARVEAGEITGLEARRRLKAEAQKMRRALCAILTDEQRAQVPFCRGLDGG